LRLCETQQSQPNVGFRSSTQPTRVKVFGQNLRSIEMGEMGDKILPHLLFRNAKAGFFSQDSLNSRILNLHF
jgi:hypothetical protein